MKLTPASLVLPVVAALPLAFAPLALADEAASKAAAQALYDEGIKLVEAGKLAEGCKKLEDSSKLFDGLGTKARLAECYEKSNRLASAWALYRGALSRAESKGDARVAELRARVEAIEPRLSKLRINVPENARVPGLKISRDGTDLPETLWGVSLPVDGGAHSVEATSSRGQWKGSIQVKDERDDAMIVVVLPEAAPVPEAPPSASASSTAAPLASAPLTSAPGPELPAPVDGSPRRTAGLVVGGAGLLGLAVGGYFGLKTIDKRDASNADGHCNASNVCDKTGTALRNEGKSAAMLSNVFVGVGAAALAGGLVLFLTAPSGAPQGNARLTPLLGPRSGGLAVSGSW